MKKVRLGIIGMGNMGTGHLDHTLTGRTPEIEVTAVADTNPARLEATRALLNKRRADYPDLQQMPAYPRQYTRQRRRRC